ncbi:PAS domain S-box protein [Leptolyngbya sp. FACHB-671]|uniref:PAS domain-containing protein n=1 Tax=Leptolyngbya sp. FACHB-671 TaxID=2692812 RepID=UPI0016896E70|nr:PAS domain-containing protein [Leptolyngbya sp. FACHB-671]MBD1869809.1 PAS domain S-box protein [Cyanobacteria bacterium FACHB-471]MBD2067945.1 PAS domain S-box protein [Leptolyngbya sp. FACHB-671]
MSQSLEPFNRLQEFALPVISASGEPVIELGIFQTECQILEQLLLRLRSAEAAKQALAKLVYGAHQTSLKCPDQHSLNQDDKPASESICIVDLNTKQVLQANLAFQRWLGYDQTEESPLNLYDIVEGDRQQIDRQIYHLLLEQHCLITEQSCRHKDGFWIEAEVRLSLISFKGALALYVVARDVTERRQIEATLQESEAKFRAVAETATSAIFIYQDEQFCYVNPATEQLTGYTQAELHTMKLWDLVDPDLLAYANRLEIQLGKPIFLRHELEMMTKVGEIRCLEIIATWAEFNSRPALIGTAFDLNNTFQLTF